MKKKLLKKPPTWKICELIHPSRGELRVDHEYQRGDKTWKDWQKCLLIDSVLRGYQIPMIYLRDIKKSKGRYARTVYHIVDGWQRISALRSFCLDEGDEQPLPPLFSPSATEKHGDFPDSLKNSECAWAGKSSISELSDAMERKFLKSEIPVAIMNIGDDETRDLFIRMQGGLSLKPQEIRDALPGNFCKLVREIGGMPRQKREAKGIFRLAKKTKVDRGAIRTLVALSLMLFLEQRKHGRSHFLPTNSASLDRYYQDKVGLQLDSPEVRGFKRVLDKLLSLLRKKHQNLSGQDIIHLILLVDMLQDKHSLAPQWERGLSDALSQFKGDLAVVQAQAKVAKDGGLPAKGDGDPEIWEYYTKATLGADKLKQISARHEIYVRRMLGFLNGKAKGKRE